mmetsp:Transcript_1083/g.4293  ORF Transcript_1083/g.4293 Transcript_1083/m.4293 type:complete len:212 (+) Transcript_1083:192-827(+)
MAAPSSSARAAAAAASAALAASLSARALARASALILRSSAAFASATRLASAATRAFLLIARLTATSPPSTPRRPSGALPSWASLTMRAANAWDRQCTKATRPPAAPSRGGGSLTECSFLRLNAFHSSASVMSSARPDRCTLRPSDAAGGGPAFADLAFFFAPSPPAPSAPSSPCTSFAACASVTNFSCGLRPATPLARMALYARAASSSLS